MAWLPRTFGSILFRGGNTSQIHSRPLARISQQDGRRADVPLGLLKPGAPADRSMMDRSYHPIERIVRYGISGVLVSVICSLGVVGFVHLLPHFGPVGANVLAFCAVQPIG